MNDEKENSNLPAGHDSGFGLAGAMLLRSKSMP
jgi:hypothetical protein